MLLSPYDDFERNTLAAVPGILGKLLYVARLRQGDGQYHHWGLARKHGENSARAAIGRAHASLFLRVLRTPMAALWAEVNQAASAQQLGLLEYVSLLTERTELLVPAHLAGGSHRHFNSILLALSGLAELPAG